MGFLKKKEDSKEMGAENLLPFFFAGKRNFKKGLQKTTYNMKENEKI
ncbi:MAG: hypothetical protein KHZ78_06310 [Peptoniphilus sp. oral taxon 375]|nr:hypothetical protein [Peptoniphilus sp. oral taxon 375]